MIDLFLASSFLASTLLALLAVDQSCSVKVMKDKFTSPDSKNVCLNDGWIHVNGQDRKSEFADANFLKSSDIPLYCCQFNVSECMFLCIRLLFRNNKTFWRFLMLSCRGFFFFFFKWYAIGEAGKNGWFEPSNTV